jgi:hypothetical protein
MVIINSGIGRPWIEEFETWLNAQSHYSPAETEETYKRLSHSEQPDSLLILKLESPEHDTEILTTTP